MTAFDRITAGLESHGCIVKSTGASKATASCPAHDDSAPSLSVTGIEGQTLIYCHAGCQTVDVLAALDLTMADLFDQPSSGVQYRYNDGRLVTRSWDRTTSKKKFWQSGNTKALPTGAFLYRVDRVMDAVAEGRPVFVVEGEKDVHALETVGVVATTNPMGSANWNKVNPTPLYGGKVLVVADQDAAGQAWADDVVSSLAGHADVAVFGPKVGKDAADHIAAGYGVGDLVPAAGSANQAGSAGFPERGVANRQALDDVRAWLGRFICTMADGDLDLLALWAAHTHLCFETYTTPRLLIDSPVPGSGKTTVLEHLERLCVHPVQMASLSSPALMTRMLDAGIRTILIDEADRSLSPDKDGVGELLAVLNSGYKRGGTRPVLVPIKGGGWDAKEMPTFAPVAMAGNNPNLPDDTRSRSIRVLLMPDVDGVIEDSDWELHEDEARELGEQLAGWADLVRDEVKVRPGLPEVVRGRARERWGPLKRIAMAAGGRWPDVVDDLAVMDVKRLEIEKEDGVVQQRPAVVLLAHLHQLFKDETFLSTDRVINTLAFAYPDIWGESSSFGKRLTPQRLGRMLVNAYNIHSDRPDANGPRGYLRASLAPAFRRFGLDLLQKPAEPAQPAEPAASTRQTFSELLDAAPDANACPACGKPTRPSADGGQSLCLECITVEVEAMRKQTAS